MASLLVELGEYDLTGPTEQMSTLRKKVKRVVVHKDYKAPTFENDIAILELESPIERQVRTSSLNLLRHKGPVP